MTGCIFPVSGQQLLRGDLTGLLQILNTEERKEFFSFFLCLGQIQRLEDIQRLIRMTDHAAQYHCSLYFTEIVFTGQLMHDASAARRLSGDRDLVRISAESSYVPPYPVKTGLLVKKSEVSGRFR